MKKMKLITLTLAIATSFTMIMNSCSEDVNSGNYKPVPDSEESGVAIQNIMTRTSVRQYTGRQIPQDTVRILLQAAMAAPSAVDKRPWEFVVLNNQEKRDLIGKAVPGVGDKTKTAGAVILICGNSERFIEQAPEYWVQDCSAATENLLLAANALGLGAVWCGVYPIQDRVADVKRILGLPDNLVPLNVITVGYPTAIQTPKDKWDESRIITI